MATARFLLMAFMLLILGAELSAGQTADKSSETNWPLEVIDFQIAMVSNTQLQGNMSMGMGSSGSMGMSGTSPISARAGEQRLTLLLKSKNPSASQTINAVQWESCFNTTKSDTIIKQFKTKKKIKPTKDEALEESIFYDTKLLPSPLKIGFRIMKIEYSDNSVWENSNHDKSPFVYKTISLK